MMKNNVKRIISVFAFFALVLSLFNIFASADNTADAKEPIDTSKKCTITLTYQSPEKPANGLEIKIYRAISVDDDIHFALTGDFSGYSITVNGIKSQTEWDVLAETIGAYVVADKIEETAGAFTDENGVVSFDGLEPGIYYIPSQYYGDETDWISFRECLVSVPGLDDEKKWIYDVSAFPKPSWDSEDGPYVPGEGYSYRVTKEWSDVGEESSRPKTITAEIFCDGKPDRTVSLSERENWTYSWKSETKHTWVVVERVEDDTYNVSIDKNKGNFTITNTKSTKPEPPKTGDTSDMSIWLIVLAVAGVLIVTFGIRGAKRYT